ncbi:MAG: hypothetical protein ACR2GU_03260 [Rubrobacteraceae bacterium]
MSKRERNLLLLAGALWGFALAVVSSALAFGDPFSLSPFLVSAYLCAALSSAAGAWVAGDLARRTRRRETRLGRFFATLLVGIVQALVAAPLAALSIWGALTINISGFSVENLEEVSKVLDIFRDPLLFAQGLVAAEAILAYSLLVGLLLSPVVGATVNRLTRPR